MSLQRIAHNGKEILFMDVRGELEPDKQLRNLDSLEMTMVASTGSVLLLSDFTGIRARREFLTRIAGMFKRYEPRIERSAVVGITGFNLATFTGYQILSHDKKSKTFSSQAEALDWLTS
jgi:hypothetical protein